MLFYDTLKCIFNPKIVLFTFTMSVNFNMYSVILLKDIFNPKSMLFPFSSVFNIHRFVLRYIYWPNIQVTKSEM